MRAARNWIPALVLSAVAMAACDETPVSLPEPASVIVPTETLTLRVGEQTALVAQVLDQDSVLLDDEVSWSSTAPGVASVSANGEVTAVSPGDAVIVASLGALEATTAVTVMREERAFIETIEIPEETMTLSTFQDEGGYDVTVTYRAFNGFGKAVCPGGFGTPSQVTIRSTDISVATVADFGNCQFGIEIEGAGDAVIMVETEGGVSDELLVVVESESAAAFFVGDPPADPTAGETVTYDVKVVNEQGDPVEGVLINFDVSRGALASVTVATGADGIATAEWTLPTNLDDLGTFAFIEFNTVLPNGATAGDDDFLNIAQGDIVSIVWYVYDDPQGTFTEVTGTPQVETNTAVWFALVAFDQFDNVIDTDLTFSGAADGCQPGTIVVGADNNIDEFVDGVLVVRPAACEVESATEASATLDVDIRVDRVTGDDTLLIGETLTIDFIAP